ncbi:RNA polymerase sigma-70 factor (ECF subfamily) [Actinoplanes tereljensis]|uniref:RNA polymerase sigma factor SigJ n=1 Tax=Paractinoplanes tereljensis TaxID=571912 RepID=A0A919TVP6_9ACTN|nr:RNA polymerase sigma factor SigJ [Actinoplanes tereljensis]GIF24186.1 RNA polymerase sigma factor SigJ [Actinoplanes tereljensis]
MPSLTATTADEFEAERPHLLALAYRMLGSRAEAEDAVQEAWLRYARTRDGGEIRDLRGWLTTVTGRICLDVLKSARVSREAYPGQWLPAYSVDPDLGPSERAEISDQVGLALLVVLERLTPEQRVALVLHDAFAVPFEDVATVLGTTESTARQHASRGRRAVSEGGVRHSADLAEQRAVLGAFLAAANSGDLQALAAVLAPDVVAIGDGGGLIPGVGTRPVVGADRVARFYLGILGNKLGEITLEPVVVSGSAGVVVRGTYADGRPLLSVLAVAVDEGRITGLFNQLNPNKILLGDLG